MGSTTDPRVLVVDDDETVVAVLRNLLEIEELDSDGAYDRPSAEGLISGAFYPVVVADIRLCSEEEGLLLLDGIRRISPRSRVVSITGFITPQLEEEALRRGSATIIQKGATASDIIAAVHELLAEIETLASAQETVDLEALHLQARRLLYSIPQRKYGLTAEETEEVVQEAWLLFLEKHDHVRSATAWLAGTVTNLCRRRIDRTCQSRERFAESETLETIAFEVSGYDDRIAVRQALATLDETSQTLCTLIAMAGYSYEEVSTRMGLPLGSIGPMYIRAKQKLRNALVN